MAKNKSLAHTKQSLLSQVKRLFEQLQAEKVAALYCAFTHSTFSTDVSKFYLK